MYRLAYVSTAHKQVSSSELQYILEAAIRNNTAANVTGILLYNGASFLQVLEGPEKSVSEIYARICADERHSHIVTILKESSSRRLFEDAPMSLQAVPSDVGKLPKGVTRADNIDLYLPSALPGYLRQILKSFNTCKG
ncbi:MAG: BLUF domain-containing protein [Henriciella sp.]|uniref:BLUF domain-containing protein n=1 Tax=Henriciella sp. TaxID=1968823 RepID=UPI003C794C4F